MDLVAVDAAARGYASWNVEYRRIGSGGGWPHTMDDVRAAVDHLEQVGEAAGLDLERVVLVGHSAGGQLALVAAAQRTAVAPAGVVGLAPVADLAAAHHRQLGDGAVERFLRRAPDRSDGRYEAASPAMLVPIGVPQEIVHGSADDRVPISISASYVAAAAAAGDAIRLTELAGDGHFDYLDPGSSAWEAAVAAVSRILAK